MGSFYHQEENFGISENIAECLFEGKMFIEGEKCPDYKTFIECKHDQAKFKGVFWFQTLKGAIQKYFKNYEDTFFMLSDKGQEIKEKLPIFTSYCDKRINEIENQLVVNPKSEIYKEIESCYLEHSKGCFKYDSEKEEFFDLLEKYFSNNPAKLKNDKTFQLNHGFKVKFYKFLKATYLKLDHKLKKRPTTFIHADSYFELVSSASIFAGLDIANIHSRLEKVGNPIKN